MIRKNQQILTFLNFISDVILIIISFYLASFIRFHILNGHESDIVTGAAYFTISFIYSIIAALLYYAARLYQAHRYSETGKDVLLICFINAVCILILMAVLYLNHEANFSRVLLSLLWLIMSLFVAVKHLIVSAVLHYIQGKGYNLKHIIVVGDGAAAVQFASDVQNNPRFGLVIDGFIGDQEVPALGQKIGSFTSIGSALNDRKADELIIALDPQQMQYMKYIIEAADKEGIRVSLIPFFNNYYPVHPVIESVGASKLVNMRSHPLDNVLWAALKRATDIVGSLILIVLTSPIMLATAIGVKASSPGPILFKQERVGKGKKPFTMLKFRSMRTDIDHNGWTTDKDPRKTKFGSFIRKCSIDELPQLFNVLAGSMSLIGPRPEIPVFVRQFKEEIPLYLVRQDVRPGMTGWAQVHGLRGDTSIEKRVVYDIWYIENWSYWLDIKILFMTVFGGMVNNEKM